MTYNHKTNHSFTPNLEFWRSMERIFNSFPYWEEWNKYRSKESFISFYEIETKESFNIDDDEVDIYGNEISEVYVPRGSHTILLKQIPEEQRSKVPIGVRVNHTGRIIKFLSKCISNPDIVHKFQHFFECAYKFLVKILNFDEYNPIIRRHGLSDKDDANYESAREKFINKYIENERGIIKPIKFKEHFNSACRKHDVPFVMFTQYDECYVVHITDIFEEKIIRDLPKFLSHQDLKSANELFIEAYKQRDMGNHKDCLAKVREGMEAIRDYIYTKYSLSKSISLHNDMKELFNTYSNTVFDFSKIPETDPDKLKQITDYLRDSILLAIKLGNFGHHTLADPTLVEENTSIFSLGLISSLFPYLIYLLK